MLSQRTLHSLDLISIIVSEAEQRSTIREFIRASYNFTEVSVRLLVLLCVFCFYFLVDLTIACYKIALDFYSRIRDRIGSEFQFNNTSRAGKIDYLPQIETENVKQPSDRAVQAQLEHPRSLDLLASGIFFL